MIMNDSSNFIDYRQGPRSDLGWYQNLEKTNLLHFPFLTLILERLRQHLTLEGFSINIFLLLLVVISILQRLIMNL